MSGVSINVKPETLDRFAENVGKFKTATEKDCEQLEEALKKLVAVSSAEEMYSISNCILQIRDIVLNAQPTLNELENRINEYAVFVRRIKEKAGL